jgi:hypothetical protein
MQWTKQGNSVLRPENYDMLRAIVRQHQQVTIDMHAVKSYTNNYPVVQYN